MDNAEKKTIEFLKKLSVKEITNATHLDGKCVKYLLEKDFEKLKSINVRAYIKILEREYGVDLQTLLDEYNIFIGDQSVEEKPYLSPITTKSTGFSVSQAQANKSHWFIWLLITVFIIWSIFYFKLYSAFDFFSNIFGDKNSTISYSSSEVVERVEDKLENVGVSVPKFDENKTLIEFTPSTKDDSEYNESVEFKDDLNLKEQELDENLTNLEDNTTESQNESIANSDKDIQKDDTSIKEAIIKPKERLWIGVIDLKTHKKTSFFTDKAYKIDLTKEQLILTGHGLLEISLDGKNLDYNDKNPYRLHIIDGKVKDISYDEFLKLNDGRAW